MAATATPVVFVHGLWLHADSWGGWVDRFRDEGYDPQAPGWPGDGATAEDTRKSPERVAGYGIDAVVDHYAQIIGGLGSKPIVVGHSFGGLIVQRLLGQNLAAAAVAIDPAPIKGVLKLPPSALRVASIALRNPANRKRAVSLTAQQFRYGFGNQLSAAESNELYERWAIPSPGRPLFEAAFAASPAARRRRSTPRTRRVARSSSPREATITRCRPTISHQTVKLYRKSSAVTDLKEFPDRGHSLTIDGGWHEIAGTVIGWLKEREL